MPRQNEIPYMLVTKELSPEFGALDGTKVFICMNLIDHHALGIGATREQALETMRVEYNALHPGQELENEH